MVESKGVRMCEDLTEGKNIIKIYYLNMSFKNIFIIK